MKRAKERGETKLSEEQLARFSARTDRVVERAARLTTPKQEGRRAVEALQVVRVKRRDPAQPLINRLQTRREQVLLFMTDFRVAFDNSATERDIRMVKLQQKIGGCFRTPEGRKPSAATEATSVGAQSGHSTLTALERAFAGNPLGLNTLRT